MAKEFKLTVTTTGQFFTGQREEVYFLAEGSMPRVGPFKLRFHADRYIARSYDDNNVGRDVWTNWRITRDDSLPTGIGEKSYAILREAVDAPILKWLASEDYAEGRRAEIVDYIRRESREYNGIERVKEHLETYRHEMKAADLKRLTQAVEHLEAAQKLFGG